MQLAPLPRPHEPSLGLGQTPRLFASHFGGTDGTRAQRGLSLLEAHGVQTTQEEGEGGLCKGTRPGAIAAAPGHVPMSPLRRAVTGRHAGACVSVHTAASPLAGWGSDGISPSSVSG